MHVAVMGAGYAGLVTGAGLSDLGLMATCVDINEGKVRQLAEGKLPIFEPGLEELVRRNTQAGRLRFSADIPAAVKNSLVVFIAVGTNASPDGAADLSQVWSAADSIADPIEANKTVGIRSTVPVGAPPHIRARLRSRLNTLAELAVASNPEFLPHARAQ